MNANELAKLLEVDSWRQQAEQIENLKQWERRHLDVIEKQQAEIEALKKDNKELHAIAQRMAMAESDARKSLQWFKDAKERQSEPVAWMDDCSFFTEQPDDMDGVIPLYTHPVKEEYKFGVDWSKDGNAVTVLKICEDGVAEVVFMDYQEATHPVKALTDEEILEIASPMFEDARYPSTALDFARAILRKAQKNGGYNHVQG